jgi:hypothetical protein
MAKVSEVPTAANIPLDWAEAKASRSFSGRRETSRLDVGKILRAVPTEGQGKKDRSSGADGYDDGVTLGDHHGVCQEN